MKGTVKNINTISDMGLDWRTRYPSLLEIILCILKPPRKREIFKLKIIPVPIVFNQLLPITKLI